MDFGLLLLRATVGLAVAAHGAQKLFAWFGGPGLDAAGQFMAMLGFHPGRRHALMAGLAEMRWWSPPCVRIDHTGSCGDPR